MIATFTDTALGQMLGGALAMLFCGLRFRTVRYGRSFLYNFTGWQRTANLVGYGIFFVMGASLFLYGLVRLA